MENSRGVTLTKSYLSCPGRNSYWVTLSQSRKCDIVNRVIGNYKAEHTLGDIGHIRREGGWGGHGHPGAAPLSAET